MCVTKINRIPLKYMHESVHSLYCFFNCTYDLFQIDLSHNCVRELPENIGEMENLQRLNLSHNKLKHLPISLGNAHKLRLLMASNNRLDSPPQSVCDEGSGSTLQFLKKMFIAHQDQSPPKPVTELNEFPRHRSNQLHSPVSNPHSAHMQYIQEQTHTTNTPSRIKTPLMPPFGSSSFDAFELRDKILGKPFFSSCFFFFFFFFLFFFYFHIFIKLCRLTSLKNLFYAGELSHQHASYVDLSFY